METNPTWVVTARKWTPRGSSLTLFGVIALDGAGREHRGEVSLDCSSMAASLAHATLWVDGQNDGKPIARESWRWGDDWTGTLLGRALAEVIGRDGPSPEVESLRPRRERITGRAVSADVDLTALTVGFDLRPRGLPVSLPEEFGSVALDEDGESWLVTGRRDDLVAVIKAAGYTISGG